MPTISIYLSEEDAAKLDRMAELENRSASNMVSTLVKDGFAKRFVVVLKQAEMPGPADAVDKPLMVDVSMLGDDGPEATELVTA